ncbi:MAG TPA: LysM peptidoglycan-binding domain-containing protein [Verrucomicrobiae bacterium]|jgi:TolA-binding protein|nr:LysM peptidoglycan-binding domain-containing protein [Verrucomicrobiae bacterium]
MKRAFILLTISLSLAGRCALAQDAPAAPPPTTASAIAAQDAADERYKRMAADIQALQMDNDSLKAKIASLEQKIDDLRQQQSTAGNSGVQEDLKRLAEKIVLVDKKREEDRLAISEEIHKAIGELAKSVTGSSTAAPVRLPAKVPPDTDPALSANAIPYIVKDGDNLSVIVKAYNADFKSKGWKTITMKQAMDANPNVDWRNLHVGQKINIPRPDGQ